jgi:topoisomerase-4 subunit A
LLLIASDGRGFIVAQDDLLSSTRKGRAALSVESPAQLQVVAPAQGDHVAIVGENRKLLLFPIDEAPRMARGKGVRMQRYKDGGVSDAKTFVLKDGLSWTDASGRTFTITKAELKEWIGHRAEAGRLPPRGFPRNNRFSG